MTVQKQLEKLAKDLGYPKPQVRREKEYKKPHCWILSVHFPTRPNGETSKRVDYARLGHSLKEASEELRYFAKLYDYQPGDYN